MPKGPDDPRQRPKKSEAEIVDKLLRQLPHADPTLGNTGKTKKQITPKGQMSAAKPLARPDLRETPPSPLKTWGWVALSLLSAIGMTQWPYGHACGWGLLGYLALLTVVLAAACWGAIASWRSRSAVAHVMALGAVTLSSVLIVAQVLPRVGYAKQEAAWRCTEEAAAPGRGVTGDSVGAVAPATADSAGMPVEGQDAAEDATGAAAPAGPPPQGVAPADREPPQ